MPFINMNGDLVMIIMKYCRLFGKKYIFKMYNHFGLDIATLFYKIYVKSFFSFSKIKSGYTIEI